MSKEIILTVEKFRDGEENKFLIKSPKEIQLTLHAIAQKESVAILYFDNAQRFLKTILLAVTEIGIWLDVGPDESDNNLLLCSDTITFVTLHQGTKLQFVCHQIEMAIYASRPAFFIPLPDQMVRLQRREYFRLPVSVDAPLKCIIPVKHVESARQDEITILDISVGGIGLICKGQNVQLEAGESYPDCQIELPDIGTLFVTILVRNLFDVTPAGRVITRHAGCEFVGLDGQMSILLQRYVASMQSKLSGLR